MEQKYRDNNRGFRKLTFSTAQKVRQMQIENPEMSHSEIKVALNLPCSDAAVSAIISGRTYKTFRESDRYNPRQKLDHQKVKEIKGQLRLGIRTEWLAVKYNVSNSAIQNIKYGLTWKDTR